MGVRPVRPRAFAKRSRLSSSPTGRLLRASSEATSSRGRERRPNRVVLEPQIPNALAPPLSVPFALQTVVDDARDARRHVAADVVAGHVVNSRLFGSVKITASV